MKYRDASESNAIIFSLALSDILMSIYLIGLGSFDAGFHGVYVLKEKQWRESWFCKTLGSVGTLSTEVSLLTVTYLSLYRSYHIRQVKVNKPSGKKFKIVILSLGMIWIIGVLISMLPFSWIDTIESRYCLFFNLGHTKYEGWIYNLIVLGMLNGIVTWASVVPCILIMHKVYTSSKNVRAISSSGGGQLKKRNNVYIWLVILVTSNVICMAPIEILLLVSLAGYDPDPAVIGWFIIVILPLNSIMNPLLYTIRHVWKAKQSSLKR